MPLFDIARLDKSALNDSFTDNLLECQIEQIDGLGFDLAALTQVLQDDSWWVISQQKSFQLHFESRRYLSKLLLRQ